MEEALDICVATEKKIVITTRKEDASAADFTDYLLYTLERIG